MYQRGRLQRKPGSVTAKLAGGQASQLVVHEWEKLIGSLRIARFDLG
jgi:hypothetical protein